MSAIDANVGQDALGARYVRCDMADGRITVMLILHDEAALVDTQGLRELIAMGAGLMVDELRSSAAKREP